MLPHGDVRDRLGFFPDLADDGGSHDAHDLEQFCRIDDSEALSERFLARPHELGQGFVDDDHGRGVFAVEVREIAAAQQRNAHGLKVAGGHVVKIYEGSALIGVRLFPFAKNRACDGAAPEHTVRRHRGVHDAGNRLGTLDDIAEELLPVIGVVAKRAEVEKQLKQVLRLEARIELLRVPHAAKKQTRSDERHQRQRYFRNHQQAPQTVVGPAQRPATAADFQNLVDIRSGRLDGRDDAEDQTRDKGDDDSEAEHPSIERKIDRTIEKKRRPEGPQHIAPPVSHQKTSQTAQQRKQRAFRQKLAYQAEASRAHGCANAQLLFPFGGLRQQQVGQIDAGDQQHQTDHAHQHAACKRKLPPLIDSQRRFVQGKEFDGAALIVAGILLLKADGDRFHGCLRLLDAHSGFQPADDREPAEAPVIFPVLELPGKHIVAHADGNPQHVGTAERDDSFEAWRRDAHNGVGRPIQVDGLADLFVVGTESPRPQAVTQDHFRVAAEFLVSVGDKRTAAIGLYAEHVEEISADQRGIQLLRLGLAAPIQGDGEGDDRQAGENRVLVAVVLVVGKRSAGELEVGIRIYGSGVAGEHLRQARRLLDGQRVQEDGVDDGEDGGVCPDAQRQRQHGHECKPGALL